MTKKGIAPTELGELPNEKRCKRCMRLLGQLVISETPLVVRWWCSTCQIPYERIPESKE